MSLNIKGFAFLQKRLFIPINTSLAVAVFLLRRSFLGPVSALNYISRVDKPVVKKLLKLAGAIIGNNCDIETGLVFHNCKNLKNLQIGNNCHIGRQCFFDLREQIIFDDNCVISMRCSFITHIDMNRSELKALYPAYQKPIKIMRNVYIGANATILMGVTIGDNCITAASALIREDIKPNTIVGGVPAKTIKKINL
jgi:acetyltransferase-like isoleucine patch superfamily enzyme